MTTWTTTEPLLALDVLVDRLERAWYAAEAWDTSDFHPYQTIQVSEFVQSLASALGATSGRRLLDVGCGIGTKLVIAAYLGCEVHGIEVRERYIATAQHLCPEATLEVGDARGFDRYGAFDLIYCYRPMISNGAQGDLEAWIGERMSVGAILILPHRPRPGGSWDGIAPSVWRKT